MNDEKDRAGLGKIIYSVDESDKNGEHSETRVTDEEVKEASKESFPASDAPGYAGGSSSENS